MNVGFGKIIAVSLGVGLVVGFIWSQRPHAPEAAERSRRTAVSVQVGQARLRPLPTQAEVFGSLRSESDVAIAPRLTAAVLRVTVTAGQSVRQGDLLVELDSVDLKAHVAAARASLVSIEETLAEAKRELTRTQELFTKEARSQQELDRALTTKSAIEAQRDASAEGLKAAEAALGYARLVAPFDSVITERLSDPGDLATAGTPLLRLHTPDSLRLEVRPEEGLMRHFRIGAQLAIAMDASQQHRDGLRGSTVMGTVVEIVPLIDAQTRTGLVKIALPASLKGLLPGMFGRAWITTGEREVLTVPAEALVRRGQLELVFVPSANGRRANMTVVRTGAQVADGEIEVLAGMENADPVITQGASGLRDGCSIEIESATGKNEGR